MSVAITEYTQDQKNPGHWHVHFEEFANTALITERVVCMVPNPVTLTLILFMSICRYSYKLQQNELGNPAHLPRGAIGALFDRDILRTMNHAEHDEFYNGVNTCVPS